ncbi:MAG: signal peptidase II [bacterium]
MSAGPSARLRGWGAALAVAAVVIALDQGSKAAITAALEPGERISLVFGIELVDVSNRGIAFGLFGGGGSIVLAVTIVALGGMLVWFALQSSRPGLWLAVGLLARGALGNLADRAREDAVTDFIDPPLWPAFNLADVAIALGAVGLVLVVFAADRPSPARGP